MTVPDDRVARHLEVGAALAALPDDALLAAVRAGASGPGGIGGATSTITVAGAPVFVKLVRLTDLERDAGWRCTSNLFDLPSWYQYGVGVGSAGFNAWRELATHRLADDLVVGGACPNFPLLHHWRVLDRPDAPSPDPAGIEAAVRFWGGSPEVRARLRALDDSRAVLALFVEHVPTTLRDWLVARLTAGPADADEALTLVERDLFGAFARLRSAGVTHFDGHLDNVLTDGRRLHLADFGLATSVHFDLDDAERRFVARHGDHDRAYAAAALVNLVVGVQLEPADLRARNDFVRRCADTGRADGLTGRPADLVRRHASVAVVINDFYWRLHDAEVATPFPAALVAEALGRTRP